VSVGKKQPKGGDRYGRLVAVVWHDGGFPLRPFLNLKRTSCQEAQAFLCRAKPFIA